MCAKTQSMRAIITHKRTIITLVVLESLCTSKWTIEPTYCSHGITTLLCLLPVLFPLSVFLSPSVCLTPVILVDEQPPSHCIMLFRLRTGIPFVPVVHLLHMVYTLIHVHVRFTVSYQLQWGVRLSLIHI